MRINHNIAALNTYRQLNSASGAQSKSMEKLSSGLRINKAGDDAAGLAISEKMRGQIRGLDMAAKNAQDGVSMLQTAEGALNETHSILQRMRELSVQSSNDTNTDADRESINTEISQLKDEIDRIGNTTEFNTKKLIDGSVGAQKVAGTANAAVLGVAVGQETAGKVTGTADFDATALTAFKGNALTGKNTVMVDGAKIEFTPDSDRIAQYKAAVTQDDVAKLIEEDINKAIKDYNTAYGAEIKDVKVAMESGKMTITSGTTGGTSSVSASGAANSVFDMTKILGASQAANAGTVGSEGVFTAGGAGSIAAAQSLTGDSAKMTFTVDGKDIEIDLSSAANGTNNFTGATDAAKDADMSTLAGHLQTDLNKAIDNYNKTVPTSEQVKDVKVSVKDGSFVIESGSDKATSSIKFDNSEAAQLLGLAKQSSATQGGGVDFQIGANQTQTMKVTIEDMRTDALGIKDIDLSNKAGAQEAITKINDAIEKVSTQRSNLGAFQNRLEHTINNLGTSSENLTAAESRVRDVDMAKEMMEQTKNSILSQAAQAMLAQANQQPQGVLQLLR